MEESIEFKYLEIILWKHGDRESGEEQTGNRCAGVMRSVSMAIDKRE